jgi:hypothetical protein
VDRYRIFISYSHSDEALVTKIESILREAGFNPMRDKQFAFGSGFHEQIKLFISHAHVFMPILTKTSSDRGWVHQEIGYAMAMNIPMLPIAIGRFPGEMLQTLHALSLTEEEASGDLSFLKDEFSLSKVTNLVNRFSDVSMAQHTVAEFSQDRSQMIAEYADALVKMQAYAMVRQRGILSSFHIPTEVITNPIWRIRYGNHQKQLFNNRLNRSERLALEQHARQAGCRLIINPSITFEKYGREARLSRLRSLCDFLETMTDELCSIAFTEPDAELNSITIVGNWFIAEAVAGTLGEGYRQTNFSRHAPSMQSKIDLFDQEMTELLRLRNWPREQSRSLAIRELKCLIEQIESHARELVTSPS